jgi:2'-5' RNA ligase
MTRSWSGPVARLFVACDLPTDVARLVSLWQDDELATQPILRVNSSLHLTLCFLGDVPPPRVDEVATALGNVPVTPVDTAIAEPVFLPEHGPKRVVALRLEDPTGELMRLQTAVSGALAATGLYKPERRPFLAHVTVARYRRPGHPFALQNVTIAGFCLTSMILYTSLLERAGAVHTPVAVFPAR